ncbi:MAG: hypothetical protein PVF58_18280 [Candidatus Methanofastidiosia archaeon]
MWKKLMAGVIILAYVSGILTLVLGHLLNSSPSPEPDVKDQFIDRLKELPWVNQGTQEALYYKEITYLHSVDEKIGKNLLKAQWLKDFVSIEEGRALQLLMALSEDSSVAVNVSQSVWFQKEISLKECELMEAILTLLNQDNETARNITNSRWFFNAETENVHDSIDTIMGLPPDLRKAVSGAPWVTSDSFLPEFKVLQELGSLYEKDKDLALSIVSVYRKGDFERLQQLHILYQTDKPLIDLVLKDTENTTREHFLCVSDLFSIADFDKELAYSLAKNITEDNIKIVASLAAVYAIDPDMGEFVYNTYGNNKYVLQYFQNVLKDSINPESLKKGAAFICENPEFVYQDRIEPYRYHVLTIILDEFPQEKVQEYKKLVYVTCEVYGNRYYLWKNAHYNTRNGWSYDRSLSDMEKNSVIELLTFFIEKNEQNALVVDIRDQHPEYLYGLVDIPFGYLVKCDGTIMEAVHKEQGTGYVMATIYNIGTLDTRYEIVHKTREKLYDINYTYSNPLIELILEKGHEQDRIFVYFCAKNWEYGSCLDHALHTRMDCIVTGVSTTNMYWRSSETSHIYPAYIPSALIAEEINTSPHVYGNPFVYHNFCAPYDEAGFKDFLDSNIGSVEVYDPQLEKKIGIFYRADEQDVPEGNTTKIIVVGAVIILIGAAGVLKL